ncbi:MAG: hypothetical protein GY927_10255 [bacterium]|nr:hypothetical protein [bacterium]
MAFGDVKIRLHPSEGGTPLELGSVGVGPTGLVNITGVETGRYSVIWRGSTHSTGSLPFYINPDEAKSVSLIAEMVNPSLPIPGEFSGIAQLNGSLVCIGGNIGRAEVFLRDSVSGAIVQSVQLTAAGNFSFERVPRGVYSITSLGVSDLGETCQQATGSTRVVVDSPVVSVGSVTLYAANALVVFAFKTGSDWIAIEPESGVNMTLKQNGTIIAQGITNEKGFVVFAALNDEAYQVSCSKGNRETSDPVLVDLSSAAPVRFAVTLIQE